MGDIWHDWTGLHGAPVTLETQRDAYQTSFDYLILKIEYWTVQYYENYFLSFRSSNPRCPADGTVLEKEQVSGYIFIFRHFCSKSSRHLRLSDTKMLIDGSGHNTQMFGYLYSMVCLHYQNSGNCNRGRNARDHSCMSTLQSWFTLTKQMSSPFFP
jgi:hypothetical protein